jgi:iron(III) transport system permease protein
MRLPNPGLLAAAALASGLVLLPLGITLADAAGAGWQTAAALLLRPLVGALLLNTLLLIACTVTLCAVIGTACAWAVERTDLPGKRFWGVLVVVPLAIPPFITSYAWISLDPDLENFAGALLVVTVSYYPLVYLPVAAALREMDPALEETARSLGNSVGQVFLRVVLPQLRPALLGGMLLVALDVLVFGLSRRLLRRRAGAAGFGPAGALHRLSDRRIFHPRQGTIWAAGARHSPAGGQL